MQRQTTANHYQKRISVLLDYIYDHIDDDLDMETLAEVALISPYHLHRVYRGIYGCTLAETIRWLRLHYAAERLTSTDMSIEDIGRKAKYPTAQSFTRVFSEKFGMPPARYRREGDHVQYRQPYSITEDYPMQDVSIKHTGPMTLIGYEHHGDYMRIGQQFEKLHGWLVSKNLYPAQPRFFGVYFHEPESTPEPDLRSIAAVLVDDPDNFPLDEGMVRFDIPAGNNAVLRHKGPYANLHLAYNWLFSEWLPTANVTLRDQPAFEEYLNDTHTVPPTELLTDIYIPLQG